MNYKDCRAFKVAPDEADTAGQFEAIVSVFGNKDAAGDVVLPGAFTDTLAEWKASGDPIPVLWSHRMDDPRFSIGSVIEAAELEPGDSRIPPWAGEHVTNNGGLYVVGKLHMGDDATDVAVAARKLMRLRLVKQFSFAYDVIDGGWGKSAGEEVYELRALKLHEVSSCQVGCNDLTQLLGAKNSRHGLDEAARVLANLADDLRKVESAVAPEAEAEAPQSFTAQDMQTVLAVEAEHALCAY